MKASLQGNPDTASPRSGEQRDPAVVAIERVLEAERAAEARLLDCRQQAETLVGAARERAAGIARHVDARISKLHTAYLQKIDRNIAALPNQLSAVAVASTDDPELAKAAHRLAAKLAGDP